ncbi:MAG: hypothetical protein V1837_04455 [Candidatus Woesearchaeota archaeon]
MAGLEFFDIGKLVGYLNEKRVFPDDKFILGEFTDSSPMAVAWHKLINPEVKESLGNTEVISLGRHWIYYPESFIIPDSGKVGTIGRVMVETGFINRVTSNHYEAITLSLRCEPKLDKNTFMPKCRIVMLEPYKLRWDYLIYGWERQPTDLTDVLPSEYIAINGDNGPMLERPYRLITKKK